jgi:hypothetical protein
MEPAYWGCPPPMYPQYPPWGFSPWAPYPIGPAGYFQPGWVPARPPFRSYMHDTRARLNPGVRSRDAIIVQDTQLPKHGAYGKNYTGDRNSVWVIRLKRIYNF